MATLSTAQITGIVSLALILSGAVIVSNMEKSYYCEPEDNVKECLWRSPSNVTCYFLGADDLTKGDRCIGGTWQPLKDFLKKENIIASPDVWTTKDMDGINCYEYGDLRRKIRCE